jgi:DNA (cytosine-5)-methyltransferase 1
MPTHAESGGPNKGEGLPPWRTFRDAVTVPSVLVEDEALHVEFPEKRLRFYRLLTEGQNWRALPKNLQKEALGGAFNSGGGKTGFLRRLSWTKPAPTLVTHPAMPATDLAHPEKNRPLSVQEYKRVQQFPDDWEVQGKLLEQYRQLGNAVPVLLGHAAGKAIISHFRAATSGTPQTMPPSGFRYSRYRMTDDVAWRNRVVGDSNEVPSFARSLSVPAGAGAVRSTTVALKRSRTDSDAVEGGAVDGIMAENVTGHRRDSEGASGHGRRREGEPTTLPPR